VALAKDPMVTDSKLSWLAISSAVSRIAYLVSFPFVMLQY